MSEVCVDKEQRYAGGHDPDCVHKLAQQKIPNYYVASNNSYGSGGHILVFGTLAIRSVS